MASVTLTLFDPSAGEVVLPAVDAMVLSRRKTPGVDHYPPFVPLRRQRVPH
jgi:hypothetical protein